MKIGSISIDSSPALALAPMAGYTDAAFRELMAKRGADLLYTELASATSLARNGNEKTEKIIAASGHGITAIQLFTSNPSDMEKTVMLVCEKISSGISKARFIDINLGCPAPKVVKSGSGSALLGNAEKLAELVEAAVKASSVPVSVKMRTGHKKANAAELAVLLEKAGVAAITVHGRTAAQKFSGKADWDEIRRAVEAVGVPIIGNGDVRTPEDALRMQKTTGCQGVMAGRAALSNPMIFSQVRQLQASGKYAPTTMQDRLDFLAEYSSLSPKYGVNFNEAKGVAIQLCNGIDGAARAREKISKAKTLQQLQEAFYSLSSEMNR